MSIKVPREQDLPKACLVWLHLHGFHVWRQNAGGMKVGKRFVRFSHQPGISDIIGWTKTGRFLAIETKRRGQKPTQVQRDFLDALNRAGGVGLVVHSLDELIEGLGREMGE